MSTSVIKSYLAAVDERIRPLSRESADKIVHNEIRRWEAAARDLARWAADDEDDSDPPCPYSAMQLAIIRNELAQRLSPHHH